MNLPPYNDSENNSSEYGSFYHRRASNLGCLRSKWVRHLLLPCLSAG